MRGAIIGDIVGSIYEFHNIKTKEFEFMPGSTYPTDDTVMTVAIMDALLEAREMCETVADLPDAALSRLFLNKMLEHGRAYPHAGYGGAFRKWLAERYPKPYYSSGNGSAMRVSPVAYVARSLEECERLAKLTAEITHNHPDGICGAQATAGAVYLALHGGTKDDIMNYVSRYYLWDFCLDEIRPEYIFDHYASICEGTVPHAVQAFLEAEDFEDAIRNAISIGGDSDTLAAITGAIAEAYFGIPDWMWDRADELIARRHMGELGFIVNDFYRYFVK